MSGKLIGSDSKPSGKLIGSDSKPSGKLIGSDSKLRPLLLLAFPVILVLAFLLRASLCSFLGQTLVSAEPPQRADIIVVLAGDYTGSRILKAAELARDGYAPLVVISGGTNFYDTDEPHIAVEFAVHHGFPRNLFLPLHHPVDSTVTEARALIPELRSRGVHKFLLVTTAFHSARAARIFRREAQDLECHPVIATDDSHRWWLRREGWKAFFFESTKTVADALRI